LRSVGAFLASFFAVTVVAVADGGYFSESWGWTAVAFLSLAGVALLVHDRIELSRVELGTVGALTLLVAWIALSAVWSPAPMDSIDEARRGLVYVTALLAFLLIAGPGQAGALVGGVAAGATVVSGISLGARLFPSQPIERDPVEGTLLMEPLGYANALGILAAIGVVLSLGLAAQARTPLVRAGAAAATMVLLPTLVLTESRGAWIALAVGMCTWALVATRRAQLLTTWVVLAIPAVIVIWLTERASALRKEGLPLDVVSDSGLRLALAVAVLAGASALATLAAPRVEAGLARGRLWSRGRAAPALPILALGLLCSVVLLAFASERSLGSRGDYWRIAWGQYEENAALGSGAGTFAQYSRQGGLPEQPLDAHSLYLETLAEVGPIGLLLLVAALVLPLVTAVKARGGTFVAFAIGAYTAYLVHAGIDWDWEMPAVTVAALSCAAVLLASGRRREESIAFASVARGGLLLAVLLLAGLALTGQLALG
jgi:hypothetical protein